LIAATYGDVFARLHRRCSTPALMRVPQVGADHALATTATTHADVSLILAISTRRAS
jgi:hypothetical protein